MSNPLVTRLETVAALSSDDRRALEEMCRNIRCMAKNTDIAREGEKPEQVYILTEGWAARYKILPDGSRQFTGLLLPGDLCNFQATALRHIDYSVVALTPVSVAAVPRDGLVELTRTRPGLAQAFWWATLVDEAVLRAWVVNLGRRDAYARIAHLACELHARMKGIGLVTDGELDLPLTQHELGDALGLTPVHVNRVLKRLRDEGLMTLRNRTLVLHDAERLGSTAGFDPGYLHS